MSKEQILAKLVAKELSVEEASALLAQAEKPAGKLWCKVGDKGTIGVYGLMSRFPVSLYAGQWTRLIEFVDELKAFLKANESHPAVVAAAKAKADKAAAKAA